MSNGTEGGKTVFVFREDPPRLRSIAVWMSLKQIYKIKNLAFQTYLGPFINYVNKNVEEGHRYFMSICCKPINESRGGVKNPQRIAYE